MFVKGLIHIKHICYILDDDKVVYKYATHDALPYLLINVCNISIFEEKHLKESIFNCVLISY